MELTHLKTESVSSIATLPEVLPTGNLSRASQLGNPQWAAGYDGTSLNLGAGNYVAIQNFHYDNAAGLRGAAVCAWIRTNTGASQIIASFDRNGVRFEKAYCANPVCVPSRTSMSSFWIPFITGFDPIPQDGEAFENPEIDLSWSAGMNAS